MSTTCLDDFGDGAGVPKTHNYQGSSAKCTHILNTPPPPAPPPPPPPLSYQFPTCFCRHQLMDVRNARHAVVSSSRLVYMQLCHPVVWCTCVRYNLWCAVHSGCSIHAVPMAWEIFISASLYLSADENIQVSIFWLHYFLVTSSLIRTRPTIKGVWDRD